MEFTHVDGVARIATIVAQRRSAYVVRIPSQWCGVGNRRFHSVVTPSTVLTVSLYGLSRPLGVVSMLLKWGAAALLGELRLRPLHDMAKETMDGGDSFYS